MSAQDTAPQSELREQLHTLYVDNQTWLQGWLQQKLGCSHRAADLLHDTFVRLLKRDQVTQFKQPKAYLMTVAKRVLIDYWRREDLERSYLEALASLPEDYAPAPEQQHIVLETLLEIDRALDGLPVMVKRAFLYAQLDGLKQKQIAEKLGISTTTVKRYLIKASAQCYFAINIDGDEL